MYEELYTREVEYAINRAVKYGHKTTGIDKDELLGIAREVFVLCARRFDPQRHIKFLTYFSRSLPWKLYEYARTGNLHGKKGKYKEMYGRINQLDELNLYNNYIAKSEITSIKDNGITKEAVMANSGTVLCGRDIKNWREEENDLLTDITFQHMSRDAKIMMDEILFNLDGIMEQNFKPRLNMSRIKAKQHAIYDYFHDQGWDEYRITTAFREIKENLKVA